MTDPNERSDEVRSTRRALGLTPSQFAELIGVSTRAVQYWERAERVPPESTLRLIRMLGRKGR
jgi:DNA-binding transcriptional regulator YiaG